VLGEQLAGLTDLHVRDAAAQFQGAKDWVENNIEYDASVSAQSERGTEPQ